MSVGVHSVDDAGLRSVRTAWLHPLPGVARQNGGMSQTQAIPGLDRERLVGLAFRMLGTMADAEDAVQEAFVRWYRLDNAASHDVHNPIGWFATTTSRICLDVLGSATRRRELYVGPWLPEPVPDARFLGGALAEASDPGEQLATSDAVSMALLAVMERMTPAERVAFVLRDVFEYSAADIAEVLGRSPGAARQLASSARAKVADSATLPDAGTLPPCGELNRPGSARRSYARFAPATWTAPSKRLTQR